MDMFLNLQLFDMPQENTRQSTIEKLPVYSDKTVLNWEFGKHY